MNNTPPLYQSGNGELMSKKKTAFLCSRQVPENETVSIYRWTNQLSPERDCILCGNQFKNGAGSLSYAIRKENTDHSGIG